MKIASSEERLNELFSADPRSDSAIAAELDVSKQALSAWRKGINKNIDIHTMMDWLGHSSERMLLQIYDHTSEERERKAIALMDS